MRFLSLCWRAGRVARPVGFLGFLGGDAEGDASIEGYALQLHVEALAVGVGPDAADACPEALAAVPVADLIGDVGGGVGG